MIADSFEPLSERYGFQEVRRGTPVVHKRRQEVIAWFRHLQKSGMHQAQRGRGEGDSSGIR